MSARKGKQRGATKPALVAYWDTSAIVPLCCFEPQTAEAAKAARVYSKQVTWWTTPVEVVSSFNRLRREENLAEQGKRQALTRLGYLRDRWTEVQPTLEVRQTAERLLNVHKLRAADALQLSAALVWCGHRPRDRYFIGSDGDLANAAEMEGFTVIRVL
ncbi:MAG: type II toxin-antitoxin system VapC family toxin [Acidobacteria bacterium]|nr:type II toxin-antitoxin system VapC family toxin [Acidobacteriota bacterium]